MGRNEADQLGNFFWNDSKDIEPNYEHRPLPTVTLAYEEYDELLKRSSQLEALERHGVDNWQGYEEAMGDIKFLK